MGRTSKGRAGEEGGEKGEGTGREEEGEVRGGERRAGGSPKYFGLEPPLRPDLQNILRQSYDYLTIMPKLRSTYDGRRIIINIL